MADIETEEEFAEVKKRRTGGFSQLIKNTKGWVFVVIIFLIMLFVWTLRDPEMKNQAILMGLVIVALVFFFTKKAESAGLISEEVAKKIAVKGLEEKKEEYHISSGSEITPTNFCRLGKNNIGDYDEWHVGIKVESEFGKIDYWRIDIDCYTGGITGIVETPTGFTGNEIPEVKYITPKYYAEE